MGQFLQTNGDYNIKTKEGGVVRLDVGPPSSGGQVIVTSDLIVEGDTLTVEAENLNVKDNIIQLNFGETGAGVSLRYAGLQIDRGSLNPGSFFWDENDDSFNLATGSPETTFNYNSTLRLKKITTDSSNPDLELIGYGNGVITVTGTADYENQITDDDDIPNKKYVDVQIAAQVAAADFQKIRDGSSSFTQVVVADFETTSNPSVAAITVDGNNHVNFYDNRSELHDLRITGSKIETTVSSADLVLSAPGTGSVVIDDQLQILTTPSPDDAGVDPAQPTDGLKIYAKSQGVGKTGLYYVNSSNVRDELISKNRSLLLSMIF